MLAHSRCSVNVFNKHLLSFLHVPDTVLSTKISALMELTLRCGEGRENNEHNEETNYIVHQMAT